MTTSFKKISLGSAAILAGALFSTAASAQSTRTWVSGVGDDVNPCSRTAPCKTFAGALVNTVAGGEINCLDAAGFGTVTITQSVSIVCDNVEAGVLASGTDGIVVAAGPNDTVVLSGLDIQGANTPGNGIKFSSGGVLRVSNTHVSGFTGTSSGISIAPATSFSQVFLNNINVSGNGNGIFITPLSNNSVSVAIKHAIVQNNTSVGLRIDSQGKTNASAFTVVDDGIFTSDNVGINIRGPVGTGYSPLTVVNSVLSRNVYGISINTNYAPQLGNNTITDNTYGVYLVGGTSVALSFGDNRIANNITDGSFTTTVAKK